MSAGSNVARRDIILVRMLRWRIAVAGGDRGRCELIRKFAAEFFGTAILVFSAVGVATLMFGFKFAGASVAAGVVTTALAFGLTLLALVYLIGPISGCHVNPAVTLGALLAGRISVVEAAGYWVAQFAGGIAGALVLWGAFSTAPSYSRTTTGLGTDGWGSSSLIHIGAGVAFVFETILTAIFVFVVLRVTSATGNPATAAIAIGLSLTVVHLVGIPITGTSVNPARSLGPALIVGGTALSQVWLFIVAPLVGGALAAGLHRVFYREEDAGLAAEAQPADASSQGRTLSRESSEQIEESEARGRHSR
ncbi:MAG TPA: aquaporin [Streptosporangiaceae bacterium]